MSLPVQIPCDIHFSSSLPLLLFIRYHFVQMLNVVILSDLVIIVFLALTYFI